MITEQYVSYEIARLLKEKGFNETCRAEWLEYIDGPSKCKTYLTECGRGLQHDRCSNTSLEKFNYNGQMYYAAPTQQMAMAWLREKGIIITIDYGNIGHPEEPELIYYYEIVNLAGELIDCNITDHNKTYEEAVEAALKYCLTNLC